MTGATDAESISARHRFKNPRNLRLRPALSLLAGEPVAEISTDKSESKPKTDTEYLAEELMNPAIWITCLIGTVISFLIGAGYGLYQNICHRRSILRSLLPPNKKS